MIFYREFDQISGLMSLLGNPARSLNWLYDSLQVRRCHFLARASRSHCATALMSKDDDHNRSQMFHGVFQAADPHGIGAISRRTHDEQISKPLIENQFGRDAAIGTTEDCN